MGGSALSKNEAAAHGWRSGSGRLYSDDGSFRNSHNMTRIYLDHAATSPLRPEARAAMAEGFAIWANPSSPHAEGRKARAALEDARARVKVELGWEGEVIFTSGASEAAALALHGAKAGQRMLGATEHDALRRAAPEAVILPVLANGAIDLVMLEAALLAHPGALVAVQSLNSETGNWLDVAEVGGRVRAAGGRLLVDASQSAAKYKLGDYGDMAIIAAHKFGGPVGVGALLVRDYAMLEPTGGHERGYRRGTENLPGVLGMAAALEVGGEPYLAWDCSAATEALAAQVREAGGVWLGDRLDAPTSYIHAIAMPGMSATAQVMRFDMMGFAVSQGSACSSGSMKTSAVLGAMGVEPDVAARTIRVSLGWNTTEAQVEAFAAAWLAMASG